MEIVDLTEIFETQVALNDATFRSNGIDLTMEKIFMDEELGPNGLKNEWLKKYSWAMEDEMRELGDELLKKWWSKDKLDMQNIHVEIIDLLHFWVSLAVTAGLTPEDVIRIYRQKAKINHERQAQGYSKATKNEEDNRGIV